MPTKNKRVNLTIPDVLYEKIQQFKLENGISSDASACVQLISMQLRGQETTKQMFAMIRTLSPEQLKVLYEQGYQDLSKLNFQPPPED